MHNGTSRRITALLQALLLALMGVAMVLLLGQALTPQPWRFAGLTDRLSALMMVLVAGIGAVCYRFALRYLKRTLAWSTVSQMGFMMVQRVLTLFPAAAFHNLGHGCYKAWSFLRSGQLPARPPRSKLAPQQALGFGILGVLVAIPCLSSAARITGFDPLHTPGELALTAMLALSLGQLWVGMVSLAQSPVRLFKQIAVRSTRFMPIRVSHIVRLIPACAAVLLLAACSTPNVPLTGTVIDAYTGKPIPSAEIKVGGNSATADAAGKFQIASWSQKDTLHVTAAGYEPGSIVLESQPQLAKPAAPTATIDTTIRPNTLSGMVTDSFTSKPLAGAVVKASETISATTNADGSYTLKGVPESFDLRVTAPNYAPLSEKITRAVRFSTMLRPNMLSGTVTDQYSGKPLANATVKAGDVSVTTGGDGRYTLTNLPPNPTVEISAAGYSRLSQAVEKQQTIDAILRPDVVTGKLVDAKTGSPIKFASVFAGSAIGASDVVSVVLKNSADGSFTLESLPEQGVLYALAPGYKRAEVAIKPGAVPTEIKLEPIQIKAWYVTAAVASRSNYLFDQYFSVIDKTEINTIIIDLKSDLRDDLGLVYYNSQVPMVKELGTGRDYMDIKGIIAEAKKRGIYLIARVQLFSHDNALADAKPEWTMIDRATGKTHADLPGPGIRYAYLDPTNRNVWEYNIQLGEEAAKLGFDEINYDYVRFSDTYGELSAYAQKYQFSQPIDPATNGQAMFDTITGFLEAAHGRVNKAGAYLSVDFFGRTVVKRSLPIGQDIGAAADHTDYIAPMIYPSLFWGGYLGLDLPSAHPYETILGSLKMSGPQVADKRAHIRPWLQDHTDPWSKPVVEYTAKDVRAQIDATKDFDPTMGWMLYNSANIYHDDAVKPE